MGWSCTISMSRPAAIFPIPRPMTNSPTSCISWARWKKFAPRRADKPIQFLVGDLNVAPLENDVWSHKQLLDVVSHTPGRDAEASGRSAGRPSTGPIPPATFIPAEQKIYSWWSYRAADWEASDRGRRLDHVWASPGLRGALKSHKIVKNARLAESLGSCAGDGGAGARSLKASRLLRHSFPTPMKMHGPLGKFRAKPIFRSVPGL